MTPDALRCAIEERAAIIEEGEQVPRREAEDIAAKQHGLKDWADYQRRQPS